MKGLGYSVTRAVIKQQTLGLKCQRAIIHQLMEESKQRVDSSNGCFSLAPKVSQS